MRGEESLPARMRDGRPLELAGAAKGRHLERIGNAVPPDSAAAIGEETLKTLLASGSGATFTLGGSPVWVDRVRELQGRARALRLALREVG